MAQTSKATIDSNIRKTVFADLDLANREGYEKVNDRTFGTLVTDENGVQRYARIAVIVAEVRDDLTAQELMQAEIDDYNTKQATKAQRAAERAAKAERDKKKREAAKAAKEATLAAAAAAEADD